MAAPIEHTGRVDRVEAGTVYVTITSSSACGSCKARQACGLAETQEKTIVVKCADTTAYAAGDAVTVGVRRSAGALAVVLGYVGALVGRVFLLIAYPVQMTSFPEVDGFDALSGATPLAAVKQGAGIDAVGVQELLLGNMPGSLGEVAALALLAGFVYLLWRKVITWHIPVTILVTMAAFAAIVAFCNGMTGDALWQYPLFHVLAGGALLGSIFMATDYATSPMTVKGGVVFAIGIGAITMCIRLWGAYPEGMSFAILIMNSVVPLLNKYIKPKRFGVK